MTNQEYRKLVSMYLAAAVLLAGPMHWNSASAEGLQREFLFKGSRSVLAQLRASGADEAPMVIASKANRNQQVAILVEELGGEIEYRADDVGYLRVTVPIDDVETLVSSGDVHAADVSSAGLSVRFPAFLTFAPAALPSGLPSANLEPYPSGEGDNDNWPPRASERPLHDRYTPLKDMRAESFRQSNPTYDGRGVRVGIVDMNLDMLLPEFQEAKTIEGQTVAKITGYATALDPKYEDEGRWLDMIDSVTVEEGQFSYQEQTYTAPAAGTFRIALFDEQAYDKVGVFGQNYTHFLDADVNRDGNPEGSSREFTVLWREDSGDVWVDTNQDLSFTDEVALSNFADRPKFAIFGTDDPATAVRESIGFTVQIDQPKKRVALLLGEANHSTGMAGNAVASKGSKGRIDGPAPGVELVNVSAGLYAYGQIEATMATIKENGADVVFFEPSSIPTRPYLLRDQRLVPSIITSRLIEKYGTMIITPTHNYPVMGAADDYTGVKGVIGAGGHQSKDSYFRNLGIRVMHDDNLLFTSAYGPLGNGKMGPDIIAPSGMVSTGRGFIEVPDALTARGIPGLTLLPAGYSFASGTSGATPTAAGAVALLVSAAKQEGVDPDPYRIHYAVTRGARFVDHLPAYKQGNGVISVAGAWEILKQLGNEDPIEIISKAPIKHSYSHLLVDPDHGVGLYEREGWAVGQQAKRQIVLTRTGGPEKSMQFSLGLIGDGQHAFSVPSSVSLPLNEPVTVPVGIAPEVAGVLSAHLTLRHNDVPGYAHRMLLTVVAAEELNAENQFTLTHQLVIDRPGRTSKFVRVPDGTDLLKIDVVSGKRKVGVRIIGPDTRQRIAGRHENVGSFVVYNPVPGVWEVVVVDVADIREYDWKQALKDEVLPPTEATLTVAVLATDVQMAIDDSSTDISVSNQMAKFTGSAANSHIGSARRKSGSISEKEQRIYELEVPPGSSHLLARVGVADVPDADLDLYVFHCATDKGCSVVSNSADQFSDEMIVIDNPKAGNWKIVVDAAFLPEQSVSFDYLDAVLNPLYGTLAVMDAPEERAEGASWQVRAGFAGLPDAEHAEGREPFTAVRVMGKTAAGKDFLIGIKEVP